MAGLLSNKEVFNISTECIFNKFFYGLDDNMKFKSDLKSIISSDTVFRKFKDFDYTYGSDSSTGFMYSIGIDRKTLEGFYFIFHPQMKNDSNLIYTLYVTKSFKSIKKLISESFDYARFRELYSQFVMRAKLDFKNKEERLLFPIFYKSLPSQRLKRKDKNMELFSHFILSYIYNDDAKFEEIKEIIPESAFKADSFVRNELQDDKVFLLTETIYRRYSKQLLSKSISVSNFILYSELSIKGKI